MIPDLPVVRVLSPLAWVAGKIAGAILDTILGQPEDDYESPIPN